MFSPNAGLHYSISNSLSPGSSWDDTRTGIR